MKYLTIAHFLAIAQANYDGKDVKKDFDYHWNKYSDGQMLTRKGLNQSLQETFADQEKEIEFDTENP